jgi:hypothetical protein
VGGGSPPPRWSASLGRAPTCSDGPASKANYPSSPQQAATSGLTPTRLLKNSAPPTREHHLTGWLAPLPRTLQYRPLCRPALRRRASLAEPALRQAHRAPRHHESSLPVPRRSTRCRPRNPVMRPCRSRWNERVSRPMTVSRTVASARLQPRRIRMHWSRRPRWRRSCAARSRPGHWNVARANGRFPPTPSAASGSSGRTT